MRFETSQHLRLGQHMKLAPRMIQSMEILQMPLAELEERIEQELESNPTLELSDGDADDAARAQLAQEQQDEQREERRADAPLEVDGTSGGEDFERLESFEESNPDAAENEYSASDYNGQTGTATEARDHLSLEPGTYSPSRLAGERDAKMDAMAAAPARSASLLDQLRGQWALVDVAPALRPLGELILSFIEEDGYLRTPLETISERAVVADDGEDLAPGAPIFKERPSVQELTRALKAIQLFLEPAGVGARTPQECLLLQLDALEDEGSDMGWP